MLRRVVILAIIPFLPLPGLAHTHAGSSLHDPVGTDRRPHFHLRSLCLWAQFPANDETNGIVPDDHDDDAIYIPVSIVLGWGDEHTPMMMGDEANALMPLELVECSLPALVPTPSFPLPPPFFRYDPCPIYLRARALLI